MMENIVINVGGAAGMTAGAVRFLSESAASHRSGRKPTKSREYPSDRGNLRRAARLQMLARSLVNPKTKVVNRMTNHERTEWSRLGCPDIDWIAAEEHSRGRDYRVAA